MDSGSPPQKKDRLGETRRQERPIECDTWGRRNDDPGPGRPCSFQSDHARSPFFLILGSFSTPRAIFSETHSRNGSPPLFRCQRGKSLENQEVSCKLISHLVGPPCCHLAMNIWKNYISPDDFFAHTISPAPLASSPRLLPFPRLTRSLRLSRRVVSYTFAKILILNSPKESTSFQPPLPSGRRGSSLPPGRLEVS